MFWEGLQTRLSEKVRRFWKRRESCWLDKREGPSRCKKQHVQRLERRGRGRAGHWAFLELERREVGAFGCDAEPVRKVSLAQWKGPQFYSVHLLNGKMLKDCHRVSEVIGSTF